MLPKCQAQNLRLNFREVEPDISHLTFVRLKFLEMSIAKISTPGNKTRLKPDVRLKILDVAQMSGSKCQAELSGSCNWHFEPDISINSRFLHRTCGFSRMMFPGVEIFAIDISRFLQLTFVRCELSVATFGKLQLTFCTWHVGKNVNCKNLDCLPQRSRPGGNKHD